MGDNNDTKVLVDMLLETLEGIFEPRRLRVTHKVGELEVTVEVDNHEPAIAEVEPDERGEDYYSQSSYHSGGSMQEPRPVDMSQVG